MDEFFTKIALFITMAVNESPFLSFFGTVLILAILLYILPCIFRIDSPRTHFYRYESSSYCGDILISKYKCRLCNHEKLDY